MENLGTTGAFIALAILVTPMIVFFVMASNIAKIKDEIQRLPDVSLKGGSHNMYLGNREIFKGNKDKAIDYYMNFLYYLKQYPYGKIVGKNNSESIKSMEELITELGGKIPSEE